MQKMPLIDCQSLIFSPQLSENRLAQALEAFGPGVLQRILCYAWYRLGLNRSAIGQTLGIPSETAKSIIKAVSKEGLVAFEDRRRSSSAFVPQAPAQPPPITIGKDEGHIVVDFGIKGRSITLSREDPLQLKTVLQGIFAGKRDRS